MYVYRVLSDSDIKLNPKTNGIFSDQAINAGVKEKFDGLVNRHNAENEKAQMQATQALFDYMKPDLAVGHKKEIEKEILAVHKEMEEAVHFYRFDVTLGYARYGKLKINYQYFANLIEDICIQLKDPSRKDTRWISFVDDISLITPDYLKQENKHQVAVVNSHITQIFDGYEVGLDLSTVQNLVQTKMFTEKCQKELEVESNIRYDDGTKDPHQVFYYNTVPSERVLGVLGPLQVDLMFNNMYNRDYLDLDSSDDYLQSLKDYLHNTIRLSGDLDLLKFYEMVYEQDRPLLYVAKQYNKDYQELIGLKKSILTYLDDYHFKNPIVRPRSKMLVLPEDYK